jgi:hypothetical protein
MGLYVISYSDWMKNDDYLEIIFFFLLDYTSTIILNNTLNIASLFMTDTYNSLTYILYTGTVKYFI